MANMFIYVEAADCEYEITCYGSLKTHTGQRLSERFAHSNVDSDFVVGRIASLIEQDAEIADKIVNEVRFGESFVIDDMIMGISIVVAHCDGELAVRTVMYNDHKTSDGLKVLRVMKDSFLAYTFNRSKPFSTSEAWV